MHRPSNGVHRNRAGARGSQWQNAAAGRGSANQVCGPLSVKASQCLRSAGLDFGCLRLYHMQLCAGLARLGPLDLILVVLARAKITQGRCCAARAGLIHRRSNRGADLDVPRSAVGSSQASVGVQAACGARPWSCAHCLAWMQLVVLALALMQKNLRKGRTESLEANCVP